MQTFSRAFDTLINIIEMALIIRAVLSWIPNLSRDNPFVKILNQVTEPILSPIRKLIEKSSFGSGTMIDFSPLIAFLILELLKKII